MNSCNSRLFLSRFLSFFRKPWCYPQTLQFFPRAPLVLPSLEKFLAAWVSFIIFTRILLKWWWQRGKRTRPSWRVATVLGKASGDDQLRPWTRTFSDDADGCWWDSTSVIFVCNWCWHTPDGSLVMKSHGKLGKVTCNKRDASHGWVFTPYGEFRPQSIPSSVHPLVRTSETLDSY